MMFSLIRYQIWDTNNNKEKKPNEIEPFSGLDKAQRLPVMKVTEFFDRLKYLYDNKLIDQEHTINYFQDDYSYLNDHYFSVQRVKLKNDPIYKKTFKEHGWLI